MPDRRVNSVALQFLQWGATTDDSALANDFYHYLSAPVDSASAANVLQWRQKNEGAYPATAAVTLRYLSVPATSVQTERLFSATGRLIMKLHSLLLPETAEFLESLNKNIFAHRPAISTDCLAVPDRDAWLFPGSALRRGGGD